MTHLHHLLIVVLQFLVFCSVSSQTINKNVLIKNIERSIDIATQLVKISNTITIENTGTIELKEILWALEDGVNGNLSFIAVKDSSKRDLKITTKKENDLLDKSLYSIDLNQRIKQRETTVITIDEVYTGILQPYPPAITQKERQLVMYNGNHYLYSPYIAKQQTTMVTLHSKNIESFSKLKPVAQTENGITYGPYINIEPFSTNKMMVHYENNSPFLSVTQLKRYIEVSHWGNIAIEESISLLHTGATLKGSFSRYEFQRDGNSGINSVKSFKTLLPAAADKPYYRDHNGNVSTSNMRMKKDSVELDLRPRFPLFGGWRTCYTLGYNVPSYQYLFNFGDRYILKIRLIDHIFDDMQVEDLETKVVLPVGATDVKLKTPYSVERLPDLMSYKYLDSKGRPVITFAKRNLVENHIQDFQLEYQWTRTLMVHEPILLVIALYALFLCVIVYVRLDFSIYKNVESKHQ